MDCVSEINSLCTNIQDIIIFNVSSAKGKANNGKVLVYYNTIGEVFVYCNTITITVLFH